MNNESLKYDNASCNQFVEDMKRAGIEVEHYYGRFYWTGPAVRTDETGWPKSQDVYRATRVSLQRDSMGLGFILYPRESGNLIDGSAPSEPAKPKEPELESLSLRKDKLVLRAGDKELVTVRLNPDGSLYFEFAKAATVALASSNAFTVKIG